MGHWAYGAGARGKVFVVAPLAYLPFVRLIWEGNCVWESGQGCVG